MADPGVSLQVWRILFWAMATLSGMTCLVMLTCASEPRSFLKKVADAKEASDGSGGENTAAVQRRGGATAALGRMWGRLKVIMVGVGTVFKTPSFLLILLGNIIGTIVSLSMGYKIMYLQVCFCAVAAHRIH